MSQEYLVIYEEDADEAQDGPDVQDELVLDIHTLRTAFRQQVDVETQVHVDMMNRGSPVALTGLLITIAGAIAAVLGIAIFASTYPTDWYDGEMIIGDGLRRLTATLFVLGGLAMLVGTILAASGRRITAAGRLEDAHIVSKGAHKHTELR